jgi:acetyltransferase-like isoleucine patch superfamily enzyme
VAGDTCASCIRTEDTRDDAQEGGSRRGSLGFLSAVDPWETGIDFRRPRLVRALERVGAAAVLPLVAGHRVGLVSYTGAGELLSLVPGRAGLILRRMWYAATLAACGRRLRVGHGSVIRDPTSRLGDDCVLTDFVRVGRAWFGSDVIVGDHAFVQGRARRHDRRDVPLRLQGAPYKLVRIGDDVWIGTGASVLADVAAHSVVGAGAVVTRAFGEWQVLGGVPAKVLRERPGGEAPHSDLGPDAPPQPPQRE